MTAQATLRKHRRSILELAERYGATNLRVFGSTARGEAGEGSDIDLLISLDPGRTLFDVGGLAYDLADLLGCDVDVVTDNSLQGRFREYVLRDAVPLERIAA